MNDQRFGHHDSIICRILPWKIPKLMFFLDFVVPVWLKATGKILFDIERWIIK